MMEARNRRILIVDDDRAFRLSTAELLAHAGYDVEVAADADEAGGALNRGGYDIMLMDLRMPGLDGLRALEVFRSRGERMPVLMISGFGTIDSAVEALQLGADDFLTKPVDPEVLLHKVAELIERRPILLNGEETPHGIVAVSRLMQRVLKDVEQVGPTESTVLITGETGSGKEVVARAVHRASARSAGPFIAVNCASLAEGTLESELFGHVRGAFTGAVSDKIGLLAAASRGTLFLDEIGDMSLRLQQRLLRAVQEREILPVGSVDSLDIDVRIVAATHRNLQKEVEGGRFREDLYYRLRVFEIHIPPLRERFEDLPSLVEAALSRVRERSSHPVPTTISPLAQRILRRHDWPGNVRELFSAVESAAVVATGSRIEAQHLPDYLKEGADDGERYRAPDSEEEERRKIMGALDQTGGSKTKAAELLGMSRTTLWRRLRELDVESSD